MFTKLCMKALFICGIALSSILLMSTTALAEEDGTSRLAQALQPVSSFKADFKQQVVDDSGELIEEYNGHLLVKRPGKLYWNATAPFAQTLVSNNQKIWFYDADLKQVTVRNVDDSLTQAPALILSGDIKALKKHFTVKLLTTSADVSSEARYLLTPRTDNSLFENLTLVLKNNTLSKLIIVDSLQQTTTISLQKLKTNINIADKQFIFTPPKGVKVLNESAVITKK